MGHCAFLITSDSRTLHGRQLSAEGPRMGFAELEQGSHLPPFWSAMFEPEDIDDDDGVALVCERSVAVQRLHARRDAILATVGAAHAEALGLFTRFVGEAKGRFVVVDVSDLAEVADHPDHFTEELAFCLACMKGEAPVGRRVDVPRPPRNMWERVFPRAPLVHVIGTDLAYASLRSWATEASVLAGASTLGTPWDHI